jgi:hypothetical protein
MFYGLISGNMEMRELIMTAAYSLRYFVMCPSAGRRTIERNRLPDIVERDTQQRSRLDLRF